MRNTISADEVLEIRAFARAQGENPETAIDEAEAEAEAGLIEAWAAEQLFLSFQEPMAQAAS